MADETAAEIAAHYTALGHSVELINGIDGGTHLVDEEDAEKQACVDRNVEHLEIMKTRDYWTSESFTAVDAAIVTGKAYSP